MSTATVLRHVKVDLRGEILTERVPCKVICNGLEHDAFKEKTLVSNVVVFTVSKERMSRENGRYRSVHVNIKPGVDGFMLCYGKNADLAAKFQEGQVVHFRGEEVTDGYYGKLMKVEDVILPVLTVN